MLTLSPWAQATAATPATCDALDSWDAGCDTTYCAYSSGDQVVWNDTVFECRPWPEGGWCVHRAYEPGTSVGDDAWVEVDTCDGDDDPGADPTFEFQSIPVISCIDDACSMSSESVYSSISPSDPKVAQLHAALEEAHLHAPQLAQQGFAPEDQLTTDRCLAHAAQLVTQGRANEQIEVYVELPEQPFDFRRYHEPPTGYASRAEQVAALAAEREASLAPSQANAESLVTSLGGTVISRGVEINQLDVLVQAQQVAALAANAQVVGISCNSGIMVSAAEANGQQIRRALGMPDNAYRNWLSARKDHSASQGGYRAGGALPVMVGIIETDNQDINRDHAAFLDWIKPGTWRILTTRKCGWWGFFDGYHCKSSARGTSGNHATLVAGVALGSIEEGQDIGNTSQTSSQQRSGIATEAEAFYYRTDGEAKSTTEAIRFAAIEDSMDVINMSWGSGSASDWCAQIKGDGLRGMVARATRGGALLVAAAGNEADNADEGDCTVTPPATYPDVLAVGALWGARSLDMAGMADYSSRGTQSYDLADGLSAPAHFVELVAGGTITKMPTSGQTGYQSGWSRGTSFSAAAVSGTAAVLKDTLYDLDLPRGVLNYTNPYIVRVLLALMGDGFAPERSATATDRLSKYAGFGRLRYTDLAGGSDTKEWWVHDPEVTEGQVLAYPLTGKGAGFVATGWKFAAIVDADNYRDSPHIQFSLVDTCGDTPKVLRKSQRGVLKWRLRVREYEVATMLARPHCLEVRVDVKAGGGQLYVASLLYSGDRRAYESEEP